VTYFFVFLAFFHDVLQTHNGGAVIREGEKFSRVRTAISQSSKAITVAVRSQAEIIAISPNRSFSFSLASTFMLPSASSR
jgi:hypothetical protein